MPEQAILDLPLVEFEQFDGQVDALQRHCVAIYGLTGLPPHADSAFHLTASLFRYRDTETLFQLCALCSFFLRSLTGVLACERRVHTLSAQARDGARDAKLLLADIKSEFAQSQERSQSLGRLLLAVVGRHAVAWRRSRAAASARLARNLDVLADPAFQGELEDLLGPLMKAAYDELDFSAEPAEVLRALEREKPVLMRPGNGHSSASSRNMALADVAMEEATSSLRGLGALKAELEDLRAELKATSDRMGVMVRERAELDDLLRESERLAGERSLALEEARAALELTVTEARERLARVEREQGAELEQARRRAADAETQRRALSDEVENLRRRLEEISHIKHEADREMTRVMERATLTESEREDLLARIEAADSERDIAARTIEALKQKVAHSKEQLSKRDEQMAELQHNLESLREELVEGETRLANAQASIVALESEAEELRQEAATADKTARQRLESDSRLTQAEARRAEAELRITQLEAALTASKEQLAQAEARVKEQRRNVEVVSGQLAEAETLSNERAAQLRQLESELADARRGLGENQARLSETSARLKAISAGTRDAEVEGARARAQLEEQRKANASLEAALRSREEELARTRKLESEQAQRASRLEEESVRLKQELERACNELASRSGASEKEVEETRQKLVTAELRLMDMQQKLDSFEEDARAAAERAADAGQRLQAELELIRERLAHAEAERSTLMQNISRGEESQKGERADLEKSLASAQERLALLDKEAARERTEFDKTRRKLDEAEAFLIARQRELDRMQTRLKYLVGEVKSIAELRTKMEQAPDPAAAQAIASDIARKMDNLFAEAGAPVTADRRTEKIVVMHLKKNESELAAEAGRQFIATSKPAADDKSDTEVHEGKPIKGRKTTRKSRKEQEGA